MNYQKQYADKINWKNSPDTSTPLNATNLNKMDNALWYMDTALYTISKAIGGGSSARGGIISNVGNNEFTTHVHQRTGESLAENELLLLRSDVSGTGNSINVYTDSSSAVGFDLLDLDGESTSITVTTDSVVVLMITDADTDYTAQVLAVIDTAGGVAYSGLGIGKKTSVSSNVIDTDIDLHRAPMAGDRLLVYFDETVQNPTGLKTYNNGVAVTSNLENATPLYINAGWNILEFKNDLLFNNVWFRKQNVPVPSTLAGMSDTLIVSPSDDQLLVFDNGKWKNQKYIEANVGFSDTELKKIKVGDIVYDTDGLRDYSVSSIANNNITISVLNSNQFVMENIAVNTGNHSGSSNGWNLVLNDGMNPVSVALKNADGSPFADDIHENELLFVYVDTAGNIARVLEIHSHDLEILKDAIITEKTVSGNPITITDALPYPAVSLSAEIEAEQDLHGQSAPYVGGAGKNKLPMTVASIKSANTQGTWNGNVYTYNNTTYELLTDESNVNIHGVNVNTGSGGASATSWLFMPFTFSAGSYTMNGCPSGGSMSNYLQTIRNVGGGASISGINDDSGSGSTFTLTSELSAVDNIRIASGYTANNLIFKPMIRLASVSDATFAPYSNICPISGRTETSVLDHGKNLYDTPSVISSNDYSKTSTSDIITVSTPLTINGVTIDEFGVTDIADKWMVVSADVMITKDSTDDEKRIAVGVRDTQGRGSFTSFNYVIPTSFNVWERVQSKVKINGNTAYVGIQPRNGGHTVSIKNIQVELGESATAYESYKSTTVTVVFEDEHGDPIIVFGGTLNVTTGVLTVKTALVTLNGTEDWNVETTTQSGVYRYSLANGIDNIKLPINNNTPLECNSNMYVGITANESYVALKYGISNLLLNSNKLVVLDATYHTNDATAWKAYLANNPLQVEYTLATPQTIQLTPTDLQMLKGYNNISSDAGGDIALTYKADRLAAIEAALAALQ